MFSIKPTMQQMSSSSDILWPSDVRYPVMVHSAKVRTSKVDQQGTGVHVLLAEDMGLKQMQTKGSDQLGMPLESPLARKMFRSQRKRL